MSRQFRTELDLAGNKVTNVADPTNPQDVATRAWTLTQIVNEVTVGTVQPVDGSELWVDMT